MPVRRPIDPRYRVAELEVLRLVEEFPGKLDFFDVVNMVPERSTVHKGEAIRCFQMAAGRLGIGIGHEPTETRIRYYCFFNNQVKCLQFFWN